MKKSKPKAINRWNYEHDPDVQIPADVWLGLRWKGDRGEDYVSVISPHDYINGKRIARLEQSSYVGTSAIGAMHWYGRIEVHCPSGETVENGKKCWHGGYMGKKAPEISSLAVQVQRRISRVEKDMAGEVIGKIGEYTYRFNAEKDVLPHAIKTFKRKFGPGWVLIDAYADMVNDKPKILCET